MKTRTLKQSAISDDLKNSEFASMYLASALEDGMDSFIVALRNVSNARGGLGALSKLTKLGRESLYKTLSLEGDSKPYLSTVLLILEALDLKLSVTTNTRKKRNAR